MEEPAERAKHKRFQGTRRGYRRCQGQAHRAAVQDHRVADDGRGVPKKSCRYEQGRAQEDGFQG